MARFLHLFSAYTNSAPLEVTMHDHTGLHSRHGVAFLATARSSELAAELLDVVNESELESLVGRIVAEAARDAGRRLTPDVQGALVAELGSTARRTLPALEV